MRNAVRIEVAPQKSPIDPLLEQACQGPGAGERGAILLAKSLPADLVLLDEWKARRIAREAGIRRGLVPDLRQAYIDLLRQGIRFDIGLLQDSLARLRWLSLKTPACAVLAQVDEEMATDGRGWQT